MRKPARLLTFLLAGCALHITALAAEPAGTSEHLPPAPFIRDSTQNEILSAGKLRGRVLRVKRPLLLVHDLDRSIRFYVDVIGLELYGIEPYYDRQPQSLGYPMFNIKPGSRKRMATLNTSDEVRGLSLEEVLDMDWSVQEHPRTSTILFESDDVLGIVARVKTAGYRVIEPLAEESPPSLGVPGMRFIEAGVIDPDGHVVALFQYFPAGPEWDRILRQYGSH